MKHRPLYEYIQEESERQARQEAMVRDEQEKTRRMQDSIIRRRNEERKVKLLGTDPTEVFSEEDAIFCQEFIEIMKRSKFRGSSHIYFDIDDYPADNPRNILDILSGVPKNDLGISNLDRIQKGYLIGTLHDPGKELVDGHVVADYSRPMPKKDVYLCSAGVLRGADGLALPQDQVIQVGKYIEFEHHTEWVPDHGSAGGSHMTTNKYRWANYSLPQLLSEIIVDYSKK